MLNTFFSSTSTYLAKYVKPNMDKELKHTKFLQIFGIILAICGLIGFALMGGIFGTKIGKNFDVIYIMIIPFLCVPTGFITFGLMTAKATTQKAIVSFIGHIRMFDSVLLVKLFGENTMTSDVQNIAFVKKLIETGNIDEYELVADVILAKKSLHMSDIDAEKELREYMQMVNGAPDFVPSSEVIVQQIPIVTNCPNCGAAIDKETDKFCQYCGTRLK